MVFRIDNDNMLLDRSVVEPTSSSRLSNCIQAILQIRLPLRSLIMGKLLASGTADFIRTRVDNNTDIYAIGEGQATDKPWH